ncbi:MAG: rod shape-determining protein MreC, partial [Edaphobacter sp.]
MESFFVRFKNVLVLVAILLAQTIGLAIQVRRPIESGAPDSHQVTLMRYWVVAAISPFERFFHAIGYNTRSAWSNYINLRGVHQQNLDLQQEIARLRLEQAAFAEDAMQGHRLQALLSFQQNYIASTVAAQVIGTSGTDLSRLIYIDKGADFHLKPDMAVITPDGIVGKVRDVFPHTSQVLLISDQTSGAGVLLASTRILAILHGTSTGHVQITNLTADSRIKPGETVLTSGGDQIFPRGLPVGTIESIAPDPDHQPYTAIRIKPAA